MIQILRVTAVEIKKAAKDSVKFIILLMYTGTWPSSG